MTDDYIKRHALSEAQPHRSFARAAPDGPRVRDKDNAQPVIPPPKTVFIPHPQLAPPGMMGARLAADAASWKQRQRILEGRKEFVPLVPRTREWDRER